VQGFPSEQSASAQHSTHRPPHSTWPAGQAHAPATHKCPIVHAAPHAPQCITDDPRLASQPFVASLSQSPNPASQTIPHTPAAQRIDDRGRDGHEVAQSPQWETSVAVSTQDAPHSDSLGKHPVEQPVAAQTGIVTPQTTPQAPQFIGSLVRTEQFGAVAGQR